MMLINGIVFAVLLFPILFQGHIVNHTDASLFTYPMMTLFGERIAHGGAIWNDLSGLGFPSLYVHGYVFQPLLWILLVMVNPVIALHFVMFLYAWLGSSLLALALLRMGYRSAAAWLGSIAFPFVLWGWLFEPTISFFLPLLGAACLAASVVDTRPNTAAWCCGIVVAFGLLSLQSHYAVLLFVAVCLVWIARRVSVGPARPFFTRADGSFALAVVAAFCVGALRVLPLVAYAVLSTRGGEFLNAYVSGYAIRSGYFLRYLFPSTPLPLPEGFFANTPFLGVGIVVLALLGALIVRKRSLAYAGAGVIVVSIAVAVPSFVVYRALRLIPGVEQLGDPTRYLILAQLALIAFAVEGIHGVGAAPARSSRMFSLGVVLAGCLLFATGLALAMIKALFRFFGNPLPWLRTNLMSITSLGNPETAILILGCLLTGILLYALHSKRTRRWYGDAAIAFVAVSLLVPGYFAVYFAGPTRAAFEFTPPTITILSGFDGVIFPFLTNRALEKTPIHTDNPELRYLVAQALGTPNTHLLHGLHNITMFDHIQPRRLDVLLAALDSEYSHTVVRDAQEPLSIERLQSQLIDNWSILERLGVTHVITPLPLPDRLEILSSRLAPEVLVATSDTGALTTLHKAVSLYIYDVPRARGTLSAARDAVTLRPDENAAQSRILDDRTGERTVIECTDCPATGNSQVQFSLLEDAPTRTHARIQTAAPQWIIIRRQLLPGWRVRVDGNTARPAIADGVFIAAWVPAGDHDIVASFSLIGMLEDAAVLLLAPKRTPWFS